MQDNQFLNYVLDSIKPLYNIHVRKMFGGYGLYIQGKIFAIIADQELYFKADINSSELFSQNGSKKFSYERNGKIVQMSYWLVLPEVLEDQSLLKKWLDVSLVSVK